MTIPGAPLSETELRQILSAVSGEPISVIVFVTQDLRLATFPDFTPTPDAPSVSAFLRELADKADEAEAQGKRGTQRTYTVREEPR